MIPDRENIRFNVLRNALYHTARRRSLESWNRRFNFLIVALGASATLDVLDFLSVPQSLVGFSVALIGALQLVFDYGKQARDHQLLQRSYYDLLSEIEAHTEDDEAKRAEWFSRMIRITGDEPPVLRAVDAKAYNDALDAMEMPRRERLFIPAYQRLFSTISAFDGYEYKKFGEINSPRPMASDERT